MDPLLPDEIVASGSEPSEDAPERKWLTEAEWGNLDEVARSQLAYERYLASRKTNWQIGRDYEQYVGFLFEADGYEVQYTGMELKYEDLGRDLIVKRAGETSIIQCKYWSKDKTIHEKHFFQLYGTLILYRLRQRQERATAQFFTSTTLSEMARQVASHLGIRFYEGFAIRDFPRIKCNINHTTGEKIFHLPFDQQYDRTRVSKATGECYVSTVREAFEKGFRRARRHYEAS